MQENKTVYLCIFIMLKFIFQSSHSLFSAMKRSAKATLIENKENNINTDLKGKVIKNNDLKISHNNDNENLKVKHDSDKDGIGSEYMNDDVEDVKVAEEEEDDDDDDDNDDYNSGLDSEFEIEDIEDESEIIEDEIDLQSDSDSSVYKKNKNKKEMKTKGINESKSLKSKKETLYKKPKPKRKYQKKTLPLLNPNLQKKEFKEKNLKKSEWNRYELQCLRNAVNFTTDINPTQKDYWSKISSLVPGKTATECNNMWFSQFEVLNSNNDNNNYYDQDSNNINQRKRKRKNEKQFQKKKKSNLNHDIQSTSENNNVNHASKENKVKKLAGVGTLKRTRQLREHMEEKNKYDFKI